MNILLRHQLRQASASRAEAKVLADLAERIAAVDIPVLDKSTKAHIAADIGFAYNPYRQAVTRTWQGAIAVLVVAVLILAQSAEPGTALYSVKQATDKVRTIIQHSLPTLNQSSEPSQEQGNDRKGANSPLQKSQGSSGDSSNDGSQTSGSGSGDKNSIDGNTLINGVNKSDGQGGASGSSGGSGSSDTNPSIDTSGSGGSGSSGKDSTTDSSRSSGGGDSLSHPDSH